VIQAGKGLDESERVGTGTFDPDRRARHIPALTQGSDDLLRAPMGLQNARNQMACIDAA